MITAQFPDNVSIISEIVELAEKNPQKRIAHLQNFISVSQYQHLYCLFQKYVPRGSEVLDWGVGNGHFSYFLTRSGYKAIGFSFEDFPSEVGLSGSKYHFVQGNGLDPVRLPFKDCSFAAVASVGVLEHVTEYGGSDVSSLREISRILKPNGVFVCFHLPNRFSFIEALARCLASKHHHQSRYTVNEISALVKKANLQLVEVKRYGFLPRNFWHRAPRGLRHARISATVWNFLDTLLTYPFSLLCQNYLFVASKTGTRVVQI